MEGLAIAAILASDVQTVTQNALVTLLVERNRSEKPDTDNDYINILDAELVDRDISAKMTKIC